MGHGNQTCDSGDLNNNPNLARYRRPQPDQVHTQAYLKVWPGVADDQVMDGHGAVLPGNIVFVRENHVINWVTLGHVNFDQEYEEGYVETRFLLWAYDSTMSWTPLRTVYHMPWVVSK